MTLRVTLEYHRDETRLSLVSRLALANGYRSMQAFLSLNAVNAALFEAGKPKAISLLSRWSGLDDTLLSGNDIESVRGGSNWRLGPVLMSKEMRTGPHHRYCPKCVMADLREGNGRPATRPYVRITWMTRAIQTCLHHGCEIVEKPTTTRGVGDFSRYVANNLTLIEQEAARPSSSSGKVDRYMADRIAGEPGNDFLDTLEGCVAHDFCRYFGSFAQSHPLEDDVETDCSSMIEHGFGIAAQGVQAIETTIADAIQRDKPLAHDIGAFFGEFRRWLRRNRQKPEFESLLDLLQGIGERNLPIGADDLFLIPTRKRHLHSVRSAAISYGLTEERVRKLVIQAGLLEPSRLTGGRCYFDAEKGHAVLSSATETMTSVEFAKALGLHPNRLPSIFKAGLIRRIEVEEPGMRPYTRIGRLDCEAFEKRLQVACASDNERKVLVSIANAAKRTFCDIAQIIELIFDDKLPSVRRLNETGQVAGLGVDVNELKAILMVARKAEASERGLLAFDSAAPSSPLLNAEQVKSRLSTTTSTVAELLRLNYFELIEAPNPATKRTQKYVSTQSVEDFADKYISLTHYASHLNMFGATLRVKLDAIGVRPIYEPTARNARYYRRSDLEGLDFSLN
jgi:hypothetical protein